MSGFAANAAKGRQSLDGQGAGQFIDTAANWQSSNPVLNSGQIGIEHDTGKIKWGNGSSHWNDLPYKLIASDTSEAAGADPINNIISLTQAEYDAIATPVATTLYVING